MGNCIGLEPGMTTDHHLRSIRLMVNEIEVTATDGAAKPYALEQAAKFKQSRYESKIVQLLNKLHR